MTVAHKLYNQSIYSYIYNLYIQSITKQAFYTQTATTRRVTLYRSTKLSISSLHELLSIYKRNSTLMSLPDIKTEQIQTLYTMYVLLSASTQVLRQWP